MNATLIIILIWSAMIAASFWESRVEGRNAWGKNKLGWKLKFGRYTLPEYHFWLFVVMFPLLISLPLFIFGWNLELFGILISAYFSGMVIEDFMWFVVNPVVRLNEWNPKFADWYPWIGIKKFHIPIPYLIGILISILSWIFIWR
ncbi:MAG: hypothetical protein Q7R52_05720 [archaeon]|nr:hypothetical protein [archaeon]